MPYELYDSGQQSGAFAIVHLQTYFGRLRDTQSSEPHGRHTGGGSQAHGLSGGNGQVPGRVGLTDRWGHRDPGGWLDLEGLVGGFQFVPPYEQTTHTRRG